MMENDGKWWKMMENDSLIDDVWCFAYVLTCYLSLRLKNKKTKQQLGYVFGCRDSMLIPQIPLSSKAHVPASQERPRAGDESRWIPKGKWTGNCRNPFYEAYIGWKKTMVLCHIIPKSNPLKLVILWCKNPMFGWTSWSLIGSTPNSWRIWRRKWRTLTKWIGEGH